MQRQAGGIAPGPGDSAGSTADLAPQARAARLVSGPHSQRLEMKGQQYLRFSLHLANETGSISGRAKGGEGKGKVKIEYTPLRPGINTSKFRAKWSGKYKSVYISSQTVQEMQKQT